MEQSDRPNRKMEQLVELATGMAARGARRAAADFLERQLRPLPVIARALSPGRHRKPASRQVSKGEPASRSGKVKSSR